MVAKRCSVIITKTVIHIIIADHVTYSLSCRCFNIKLAHNAQLTDLSDNNTQTTHGIYLTTDRKQIQL